MFNTLYCCPRTVARHENGALAESRRRYLEHLAVQGAAIHTIRAAAGVIYRDTILMKLDESSPVERKDVKHAAKRWANRWYRNASSRGPDQTDKEFWQTTCKWLRFSGRLRESDRSPAPHQQEIDALCRYIDVERGLSPATIATQRHYLKRFFRFMRKKQLSALRLTDVERFLIFLAKKGWTRAEIRGITYYLRMFNCAG
jgi:Phage integrase, N-terminal SAM-like domain